MSEALPFGHPVKILTKFFVGTRSMTTEQTGHVTQSSPTISLVAIDAAENRPHAILLIPTKDILSKRSLRRGDYTNTLQQVRPRGTFDDI